MLSWEGFGVGGGVEGVRGIKAFDETAAGLEEESLRRQKQRCDSQSMHTVSFHYLLLFTLTPRSCRQNYPPPLVSPLPTIISPFLPPTTYPRTYCTYEIAA
mgnify:CR=1 FL=1